MSLTRLRTSLTRLGTTSLTRLGTTSLATQDNVIVPIDCHCPNWLSLSQSIVIVPIYYHCPIPFPLSHSIVIVPFNCHCRNVLSLSQRIHCPNVKSMSKGIAIVPLYDESWDHVVITWLKATSTLVWSRKPLHVIEADNLHTWLKGTTSTLDIRGQPWLLMEVTNLDTGLNT